jgi:hypothetical protein
VIEGVTENSGVILSGEAEEYLRRLRAALPSTVPLHVTSGTRTSEAQARAMLAKIESAEASGRSASDELHGLYKNDTLIDVLLALPRELSAWTATIEAQRLAGNYISAHQRGRSFDLRSSNLNSSALDAIVAAVKGSGGAAIVEKYPPHIHVDVPDGDPSTWRAVQAVAVGGIGLGTLAACGGAAAALAWYFWPPRAARSRR